MIDLKNTQVSIKYVISQQRNYLKLVTSITNIMNCFSREVLQNEKLSVKTFAIILKERYYI